MVRRPFFFVSVSALFAAGCSCPNLPLDPVPVLGDSDPLIDDSQPETNPWDSDDPPDDSEPDTTEPVEGSNQLMNGGFEQGEGAFSGVGYGWETADGSSHGETYLDYHTPYAGTAAQCITGSWSAAAVQQITREGTIQEGTLYRLRAMVRSQSAHSGHGWYLLGLRWYQGETYVDEVQMVQPKTITYDWTQISIDAPAPVGVDRASAYLAAYTDGTACYDEVVLTDLSM
jgi:hypothetical protein